MPTSWRVAPLASGGAFLLFVTAPVLMALPQSGRCDYGPVSIICPDDRPVVARSAAADATARVDGRPTESGRD